MGRKKRSRRLCQDTPKFLPSLDTIVEEVIAEDSSQDHVADMVDLEVEEAPHQSSFDDGVSTEAEDEAGLDDAFVPNNTAPPAKRSKPPRRSLRLAHKNLGSLYSSSGRRSSARLKAASNCGN